jgi:methylmalonyl-CoA decarboxylase subunit alpha
MTTAHYTTASIVRVLMPNDREQVPDPYHLRELEQRLARARAMGGDDKIARQHAKGRLTARERIERLVDAGSFDEQGLLAHSDLPEAADKTPADGKIGGYGAIAGRTVFVGADDVTVMAGSGGRVGVSKLARGMDYAAEKGLACVQLGDAGGARVPDIMGSVGMMSMVYPIKEIPPRNRRVPLVTAIMGECYGGSAWTAAVSDLVIQVKGTAMCVSGPSILEIATAEKATDAELGGWELHAKVTGQVDLFAENDVHALELVRYALSYFPSSVKELPPAAACAEGERRLDNILELVPENPRMAYDMHKVIEAICDTGSVLELRPWYDGSLITALARLDGQVVGILANNPRVTAGAMGPGACEKAVAFICLCDSFHIPLVFLHDTPGFFVGKRAEEGKMPLRIMNFIEALHQSTVPRVGVIVRKSYGMAHCNMAGGNMGSDVLLAWPTADVSFMAPAVAVNVVYGRKLAQMENSEAMRESFAEEISRGNAPWPAAGLNLIDKVIDPRDTRIELIRALKRARGADGQAGRSKRLLANWPRMA